MEQFGDCLNCFELKKVLKAQKKKYLQKIRLISLLKELVQSYEAKDFSITFQDLAQIYESSASEVSILKQRLSLYLNENQELIQLKNETGSRNELLEKKCRDSEDELSHLRFVNKQLGDYYREKEADHDQYKDRLKKLARKLLVYEPRNLEARKILNLQHSPIESDKKTTKSGNKKKVEESVKDIKKDSVNEESMVAELKASDTSLEELDIKKNSLNEESVVAELKASDMNLKELEFSENNQCDYNEDISEIKSFLYSEECSNNSSSSIEAVHIANDVNDVSEAYKGSLIGPKPLETPINLVDSSKNLIRDDLNTNKHSDDSSHIVASINPSTTCHKTVAKDTPNDEINKRKENLFTDNVVGNLTTCNGDKESDQVCQNISFTNNVNINYRDSNDSLEFDNSLPDLISPLKSDESRVISTFVDCEEISLQQDSVIYESSEDVDNSKEDSENSNSENNDKVSADIKNECCSNSSDQADRSKKSPCPPVCSKCKHDKFVFNGKSISRTCMPITGSHTNSYNFQSPNYMSCCSNNSGTRTPVVLKLYNCNNVEISIPPSVQKEDLPVITLKDSHSMEKTYTNASNLDNKQVESSAFRNSFNSTKINEKLYQSCDNPHLLTVPACNRQCFFKTNPSCQENLKESSIPLGREDYDKLKNSEYYFLDYLSKNGNKIASSRPFRNQSFDEDGTLICNRLFPVKMNKQLDMEQFCYKFQSLTLNCSLPECSFVKIGTSNPTNTYKRGYSSLFSISKPPVFHNTLQNSFNANINSNSKERIFGQNIIPHGGLNQPDLFNKCTLKPSKFRSSNNNDVNILNQRKKNCNLLQTPLIGMKVNRSSNVNGSNVRDSVAKIIPGNQLFQQPHIEINVKNGHKTTKRPFKSVGFSPQTDETLIPRKVTVTESRVMSQSRVDMKSCIEKVDGAMNLKPLRNESVHPQNVHMNEKMSNAVVETSKNVEVCSSNLTERRKSIFDLDYEKNDTSNGSVKTAHCSIQQKQIHHKPHISSQEAATTSSQPQKPSITEMNLPSLPEKVFSETRSKPYKNLPLREKLSCEIATRQLKDGLCKNLKTPKIATSKSTSKKTEVFSAKQELKEASGLKRCENKSNSRCSSDEIFKTVSKERSSFEMSVKPNHSNELTAVVKKCLSAPKPVSVSNTKEPVILAKDNLNNDTDSFTTLHAKSNNFHVNGSTYTDEEDISIDQELEKIFKEYQHVPLLSPLRRTPDISLEEKSSHHEVKEMTDAVDIDKDLNKNDKLIDSSDVMSTSKLETKKVIEPEDAKKQLIQEEPAVNNVELSQCKISCDVQDEECIDKNLKSVSLSFDFKKYNIFSDEDEINIDNETSIMQEECSIVNENVNNDTEIETLRNAGFIKSYTWNKNKTSFGDKPNEEEKSIGSNSLVESEQKSQNINKIMTTISDDDSDQKTKLGSSVLGEKDEINSSGFEPDKPAFSLGFYVNRTDKECINSNVSSPTDNTKTEYSMCDEKQKSDKTANTSELNPSPTICYTSVNNSEAHSDEQEKTSSIAKDETVLNKRKQIYNDDKIEDTFIKKQKTLEDNECIPCENDVFVCALKYLSAMALADSATAFQKTNLETVPSSISAKIAINHIKNLILGVLESVDNNSYDKINDTVKKIKKINEASAVTLAKAIIEVITESNDSEEIKIKTFIPAMTKTVKLCLLISVSFIGYNRDYVMEFLEVFELHISSFYDKSLTIKEGSHLAGFYTAFCRSYNLDYKVKFLIYDVLYTRNIKAYPMVYKIIKTWPDIMPNSQTSTTKECLLTQTIVYILLSGTSSIDEKLAPAYCTGNIRAYLQKYFGYKCDGIRKNDLTDFIIEKISTRGGSLALVLLCKCESWEWACTVVEKKLFPVLQSFNSDKIDEFTLCEYILTVGRIVRGFPITKAAYVVKNTLELFDKILHWSESTHLSEIVIEAISLLRRHNLMKCTSILMNWNPKAKQVTKKTMSHIKSILRVKNIIHWKHVYSVNCPNANQSKRTFRSKRKF